MLSRRHSTSKLLLTILVSCVFLFQSCDEAPPLSRQAREPEPTEILRAQAYADSALAAMSLPEKVGQLLMVTAPAMEDSIRIALFAEVLREYHIGGIVLPDADRNVQTRISEACRRLAGTSLWVALDADAGWSLSNGYPTLLTLGAATATGQDDLAYQWGRAIGAEAHNLGAQICFSSVAKVCPQGMLLPNSTGSSHLDVDRVAGLLLRGMRSEGLVPCLRAVPSLEELPPDTVRRYPRSALGLEALLNGTLFPLQSALESGPAFMQSTFTTYTSQDSLPAAFSSRVNQLLLRKGLKYDRPIFSPSFGNPWFGSEYGPGEAETRALIAGLDVIVQPADPAAAYKAILLAVEQGRLSASELDEKVRRVLFQKAMIGPVKRPAYQPSPLRLERNALALKLLNREISKASLTLLRDRKRRLPLRNNIEEASIATLAIGEQRKSAMQSTMDAHAQIDHYTMGSSPSASACKAELARMKRYDYVLVSLHPSLTQKSDTLPTEVRELLAGLNAATRLVVTHFGNMLALDDLDTLDCVLAAYDDRDITQDAAGQFLWGGIEGRGRLPVQVCGKFCQGDGLPSKPPIRLEYVDPDDLGITAQALHRIDSVINNAIWIGAFPGCQVLAAKDGKIFLNKGYGFHDYDHSRRVQSTDLYDIASVTKIASTTLMAMRAYEEDTLKLMMPLRYYLEELDSNFVTIKDIVITDLMIHQAGLPPGLPVYKYYTMIDSVDSLRKKFYSHKRDDSLFTVRIAQNLYFNRNYLDTIWNRVRLIPLNPVREYKYSDVSMFLMKAVLERIYGKALDTLVRNNFFRPLGLQTACYHPLDHFDADRIAPTERDSWWRKQQLDGYVHDHSTALFGGVGGQAGVFSDARDLAIIMQMLLNGGEYGGKRYFKKSTVEKFTSRQPGSHRGLGFDMQRPVPQEGVGYNCISASPRTFGHFGFTGTCVWADPDNQVIYVLLSNRVYPKAENWGINSLRVRQSVQQAIYDALGLMEIYCEEVDLTAYPEAMPPDTLGLDTGKGVIN